MANQSKDLLFTLDNPSLRSGQQELTGMLEFALSGAVISPNPKNSRWLRHWGYQQGIQVSHMRDLICPSSVPTPTPSDAA